jgi:glycogen debranching enzyme
VQQLCPFAPIPEISGQFQKVVAANGFLSTPASFVASSPMFHSMRPILWAAAFLLWSGPLHGQTPAPAAGDSLRGIPKFELEGGPLFSAGTARPWVYLADQGRRAAIFGDEAGSFEVWAWPLKLVRDLRLAFKIPEYDEPIAGATIARSVVARPEGASIVYSHPSFTVRQHVFAPLNEPGVIMLLEVETVRPLDVLVRMHADFNLAWPGSMGGGYITWQAEQRRFLLSQGGVRLYNAMIGSPFATLGTTHPAHDAPMVPSQFTLRFDPAVAVSDFIPIVIAGGATTRDSVELVYRRLLGNAPAYWREKVDHYRRVRQEQLSIETPDSRLNQALEWAKVNLDQQLVCNPDLGCGLVAGFGRAGAGNFRPGFGWYFGGDAAINSFAMSGLGQFNLVREGLLFLAKYQRADGKIAHEISHAAARLPWFNEYPYTWFHGDTTPFWIMACTSYWNASADQVFLKQLWPNIVKAFLWSAATDSDGDGLMENPRAGAGAIEVGGLGEQLWTDIYLAGVWVAALDGLRQMARAADDGLITRQADSLYAKAQRSLEEKFWMENVGMYAFAILQPQTDSAGRVPVRPRLNEALTVWPATAMSFGLLEATRADRMLREIGSSAITADWGTRMLSRYHRLYDPLHYNNGTVWPFVTGFAALAHYRYHRGWAGHDLVRDVARSTFDFARGRTPELLSGAFYNVLDTAVPQQFFATSMMVTPLLKGLLGLEADAPNRALSIEPHLPADWNSVLVNEVALGRDRLFLTMRRGSSRFELTIRRATPGAALFIRFSPALPLGARIMSVRVDDRDVPVQAEESAHDVHALVELSLLSSAEVQIEYEGGMEIITPAEQLQIGDPSSVLKVLDFRQREREYVVAVEGVPGGTYTLALRTGLRVRSILNGELLEQSGDRIQVRFRFDAAPAPFARREIRIRT